MTFEIVRLDHVQLAMPPGREDEAEAFYSGVLGFERLPQAPSRWPARGGCWFVQGAVALHLGVEEDFRPARKAHPALAVKDLAALEAALRAAGVEVRPNDDRSPGTGSYADDPFGNRLEFMADRTPRIGEGWACHGGEGGRCRRERRRTAPAGTTGGRVADSKGHRGIAPLSVLRPPVGEVGNA